MTRLRNFSFFVMLVGMVILLLSLSACSTKPAPTVTSTTIPNNEAVTKPTETAVISTPDVKTAFSEDFNESLLSGQIWNIQNSSDSNFVGIKDGRFCMIGSGSDDPQKTGMAAYPQVYDGNGVHLLSFSSVQTSLMLSADHQGGFVDVMVKLMSNSGNQLQNSIYCHIAADVDNQPVMDCEVQVGDQQVFKHAEPVKFDEWHKVSIHIDPVSLQTSFSIDGKQIIGPVLDKSVWLDSNPNYVLQLWSGRSSNSYATGCFDDLTVFAPNTPETATNDQDSTVSPEPGSVIENPHLIYNSPEYHATGASGLVVSPDGTRGYLTALGTHELFVIDLSSKKILNTIDINEGSFTGSKPFRPAITPDGKKVYTANVENVSVIDTSTNHVIGTLETGHWVRGIQITPDGTKGFIDIGINRILVFDPITDRITQTVSLNKNDYTYAMILSKDGSHLVAVSETSDGIRVLSIDVNSLSVIDQFVLKIDTTNQSIPALSSDSNLLYLPSGISGSYYGNPEAGVNKVYVVDLSQHHVIHEIGGISGGPTSIIISRDGSKGYVTTFSGTSVYTVDLLTNKVLGVIEWSNDLKNLPRSDLRNSILSMDGTTLYVVAFDTNGIIYADLTKNVFTDALILNKKDKSAWEIVMSPDNKKVFVTTEYVAGNGGSLIVIDLATNKVQEQVPLEHYPINPVVSLDGKQLYFVFGQNLQVMDLSTYEIEKSIRLSEKDAEVWGLEISKDQKKAYVANMKGSDVAVVNLVTGQLESSIEVGYSPHMLELSNDGKRLYVGRKQNDMDIGGLAVVDTDTQKVIATIDPPSPTQGGDGYHDLLVLNPDNSKLYWVTNADHLNIVNTNSNTISKTITIGYLDPWFQSAGYHPSDMAFTSDGSTAYIPLGDSHDTAVFDTKTDTIKKYIFDTGLEPVTIVITPDDHFAYLPTKEGQNVVVLDLITDKIAAQIPIP